MRPRRYATNAERQAAYRARKNVQAKYAQVETKVDTEGKQETLQRLRELIKMTPENQPAPYSAKPRIFTDDYGRVITEGQWEKLQDRKREAKEKGFEIDE